MDTPSPPWIRPPEFWIVGAVIVNVPLAPRMAAASAAADAVLAFSTLSPSIVRLPPVWIAESVLTRVSTWRSTLPLATMFAALRLVKRSTASSATVPLDLIEPASLCTVLTS
ncbi:hypothetical protein D3C87_1108160 [compost metagenome]